MCVVLEEGGELGGGGLGDGPGPGQVEGEAGHGDGGVGGEAHLALLLVVVVQERLGVRREVLQLLVLLRTKTRLDITSNKSKVGLGSVPLVVWPVEVVEVLVLEDLLGLSSEEPLGLGVLAPGGLGVLHGGGGERK